MAPFAEEMKTLVDDVRTCAGERMSTLAEIRSQSQSFLKDCRQERLESFRRTHDRVSGRIRGLAKETAEMLDGSAEQRRAVAKDLARMAAEVHDMAEEMLRTLRDGDADRMRAFQEMHDRITGRVRELADETGELLSRATAARQDNAREIEGLANEVRDMEKRLRADMADAESERMHTFQEMRDRIAARVAELAAEARRIRDDAQSGLVAFGRDIREARGAWQGLAVFRGHLSEGVPTEKKEPHHAPPSDAKATMGRDKKKPSTKTKGKKSGGPKGKSWHLMTKEEKAAHFICESPNGVTAAKIGHRLGISPQQAGKIAKHLAETQPDKIGKDEDLGKYHPVT